MPEEYQIRISPAACENLISIFEHIKRDSPQNAEKMTQTLLNAVDSLVRLPYRCRIHRSTKDLKKSVHAMSVRPYIIYFRINAAQRIVEVISIRHGAQKQFRNN